MRHCTSEMVDAGGPGSVTWVTLKGSIEAERKISFTLSSCPMRSTKEKSSPPPGSLKFEMLSDVDISHAVPEGSFIALCFLGANGLPLQTPSNKLVVSST